MTRPRTQTLLLQGACLLVLLWLYGGDLLDAVRARSAEVAAFLAPPPLVWPALVLVAALGVLGVGLWGVLRRRDESFKGYRLPAILLVCALFVDLVLAEGHVPLRPDDVAALSLRQLQDQAQALATRQGVPADPAPLRTVVEGMGQPPYLVRGTRVEGWSLQVRDNCQGPVQEVTGLRVGTFLYCVAPGRRMAWITLVALPWGQRFGDPAVFSLEGQPYVVLVQPLPPEQPPGVDTGARPAGEPALPGPAPTPSSEESGQGVPSPTP